jgi:hypothetical protein
MLVELGFDSEVMGTQCTAGPSNPAQCKAGPTARVRCDVGSSFAVPTVCSGGSTPGS